jgi:hypothetical protein
MGLSTKLKALVVRLCRVCFISLYSNPAFFGNTDTAEPSQALQINDVKGQSFTSEFKKNFDNGTSQHLIGAIHFAQARCVMDLPLFKSCRKRSQMIGSASIITFDNLL